MDTGNVIALGSLGIAAIVLLKDIFRDSKKDTEEDTKAIAVLHAEMQSNTKQLERIENKLNSIEKDIGDTNKTIIRFEERIKTLFSDLDKLRWRVRRLENHLGIGGEEDEKTD